MRSLFLCLAVFPAAAFAEPGWFGLSQRVEVSWAMNVDSAVVNHVAEGSPADRAGIAVGDALTSIEGCAIPGCGAFKAKGLMEGAVGETLNLKLRRQDGAEYAASLVAVPAPKTQ